MAQIKANGVDAYVKRPDPRHKLVLIYGPDTGLVSERAAALAKASGADLNDPFSTIRMASDDVAADPSRLADEAHTVSMFGGTRLIWLSGHTARNLVNSVQPLLDLPPEDALVLIEAGDLKKSAPLRTRIEKSDHAVALPCFQDQGQAIDQIISEEMQQAGLNIPNDTRMLLKSHLGGDRMASRGEVKKLALYAMGQSTISDEDVLAVVGDASALALDTVVDAASTGDVATMEQTFKRLLAQGTQVFQVLLALQRHFQMLHIMRARMDGQGQPATAVVSGARPPINFKRKDKILRALNTWPLEAGNRVLERLNTAIFETRVNEPLSVALANNTLMAIAMEARKRQRSRRA